MDKCLAAARLAYACLLFGCSGSTSHPPAKDAAPGGPTASDAGEPAACGTSSAAISACVDEARLRDDLTFIAAPRLPRSPHWQAVQDLCAERFAQYGFDVELHDYGTGINVIGTRRGTDKPDEQFVISAHYDHIANCAGADDNASGVSAVLETARVLEHAALARTLILACWDEEERGLLGARAYAARARANGDQIIAMTSLEMIGYKSDAPKSQQVPAGFELIFSDQLAPIVANQYRGDFVSIVALDSAATLVHAFEARAKALSLPSSALILTPEMAVSPELSDLGRSDHAAFWREGFPAIMLNDSGNFRYAQYHCKNGDDVPALLDFDFMTRITRASVAAHLDLIGLK